MVTKTNKKLWTISGIGIFILFFAFALSFFKESFAITVDDSGVPTSTFTSNYSGTTKINYLETALGASDANRKYFENFATPKDYRTKDNSTPLYILTKNAKFARNTEEFQLINGNPMTVTDSGLKYILAHGYNNLNIDNIFSTNKYGVIDNSTQEYLTQIAIWLYLFENKSKFTSTYCKNINIHLDEVDETKDSFKQINGCDFYHSVKSDTYIVETATKEEIETMIKNAAAKSGYQYFNYVLELVENAKNYTSTSSTLGLTLTASKTSNYTISKDGKTLHTETISPTATNQEFPILSYKVEIEDPNNYGAYITDPDGKKIENSNVNNKGFKLYIPLKDDMDISSVKVTVTAKFLKLDANSYYVTNTSSNDKVFDDQNKKLSFSDVLLGYIPTQEITKSLSLNNLTKISKKDKTNKEELPGAKLVIKNKTTNKEVDSWTSTSTPKYIYLENGDYTLCETLAPENYKLQTECVDFTVDGSKTSTITMENELTEKAKVALKAKVPDTGAFIGKISIISGITAILIGIVVLGVTIYKKRNG